MNEELRKLKKKFNIPWITEDGYFDPAKYPIDNTLKQTLSNDFEKFRSGCSLLGTMYGHGRTEAGVFLLGLFRYYQNDLDRLIIVVDSLGGFKTKECADSLFFEIERIRSSNTTRTYINTVLKVLSYFPLEIVQEGFQRLSEDKTFSYRMRKKFKDILEEKQYRSIGY